MTTMYYNPRTNRLNNYAMIDAAYELAGIPMPDRTAAVVDEIHTRIGLNDLLTVMGREAVEGVDNAREWVDNALQRVLEAQAVDALQRQVAAAIERADEDNTPAATDEAAQAVGKAFKKTADTLAKVAPDLPEHDPFDLEQIVAADTTRQMKTAQSALEDLSVWGGIFQQPHPDSYVTPPIARLLPVVAIPPCHPEEVSTTRNITATPVTGQDLGGTHAVRALTQYAERHGGDAALLAVARGKWQQAGITLSLATIGDLQQRRDDVRAAHTRTRTTEPRRAAAGIQTF